MMSAHGASGGLRIGDFGDDREPQLGLEQQPEAGAHHHMVIGEHNPDVRLGSVDRSDHF
jgi:hypothetical protein